MNNRLSNTRQGRPWQMLLLVLFAWLLPLTAAATHVDDTWKYQVALNGSNTIRIEAPVYDMDGADCWVTDGNLKVTWTDDNGKSQTKTVFHWQRNGDTDSSSKDIWIHFRTDVGGSIDVTQGNTSNHFTLTSADGDIQRLVYRNNDGNTYTVYAVWRLPYDMLGKDGKSRSVKFTWDVQRDGNSRSKEKVSGLSDVTISVPAAQGVVNPQVTMASLAYSEVGKLEVPWFIASTKLTAARYEYINASGQKVQQQLPTNVNSGTIYLNATEPHHNFRVVVSYKDNDGYDIKDVSSETQNLKIIHAPVNFSATPTGDRKASVRLSWSIQHPSSDDLTEMDFFEIQRSLTGEEADFVTIGSEPFVLDADNLNYTYTDSTLIDAVSAEHLGNNGTLDRLTYRVRRMITQNWGWDGNNCVAASSCVVDAIHLLRISNYTARWEDERAYSVRVAWDYANEPNAVWDNRAKMMLRITSTNRAGEVVETQEIELNAAERQQRYKVINLTRPCVDYKIEVYVDPGTSPLRNYEDMLPYYFPIRSAEDWNIFCQMVNLIKGEYDVNARLYADITTNTSCGNADSPYRGHFDGNGHTLTFNIAPSGESLALFRYVANNVCIRNLHVTGKVRSTSKFAAGLIGQVLANANVMIGNCRSSVTVNSTINGDATNGGFIGVVRGGSNVTLLDCLFDGSLLGEGCHSNGGFVGYGDPNTTITIENSLFSPTLISTKYENCQTWARMANANGLTVTNSYATLEYNKSGNTFYIRSANDWITLSRMIYSGECDQADVVLINDIEVSGGDSDYILGTDDHPFKGTFDGNGHTLKLNLNYGSTAYIAPFRIVSDCTIKNLHVSGSVKGTHSNSGVIGYTVESGNVNIENVRVSADITSSRNSAAGFIGYAYTQPTINISDCLFDGTIATSTGNAWCAAIIGWADDAGTTWSLHRVYENGTYQTGTQGSGFCANAGGFWGTNSLSTNCRAAHNWSEMYSANHRNLTDQSRVVAYMNEEMPGSWQLLGGRAVPVMESSNDQSFSTENLLANLGLGWQKEGDAVVPVMVQFDEPADSYPTPTLPTFHHESIGKVEKTLVTQTRQSSVVITWDTDGNPVDYFQVLRRVVSPSGGDGRGAWEVIADQLDHTSYEDKTVSPLSDYEYMVRGANDCEGLTYSETDIAQGACKHTGRVSGYVRLKDGTGVPGIKVSLTPTLSQGEGAANTAVTDESGYFVADELSYFGKTSVTYTVTPVSSNAIQLEVESYAVTFDNRSNDETLHEFIITNSHRFTGYVMYDGTSIPVKGARFRVNGQPLHNNKGGYVETDFDGSFSFNVLDGRNVIQAVMDGHTFTADGYFKGTEGHVFTDDVAQIYFYDDTKVKLTGRVVGGDDQGRLPLDNNLSRNNLGDDLTMVFTLEGDNTSWLVYDNLNPERSQRDTTYIHTGGNHSTQVQMQRKRIVVKPDSATGEYVLMLPPVRWKVQQVYCKGYPTLFQDGMVSEVVDLTDCLTLQEHTVEGSYNDVDGQVVSRPVERYNATYSRIYHSPVEITYRQNNYDNFDYFGDKTYTASTIGGDKLTVPLAFEAVAGYQDYTNPFDVYTHTPTLIPQDASHEKTGASSYEKLFDGNPNTKWCVVSRSAGWWVNFKADKPVSIKTLDLTTGDDTQKYSGRNPQALRLLGRAAETDEWTTLLETADAGMEAYNLKTYQIDVPNHTFCQFFRLEIINTTWGYIGYAEGWEVQLGELSLTCRGQADSNPSDDHGPEPIMAGSAIYTFGHPVFSLNRKYPIDIQVAERYPYNNEKNSQHTDLVKIGGGQVTVRNGMRTGLQQEVVTLDSLGQGRYYLLADQTTRLLTGEDALKTVTMTLTQDGTTYEAKPLQGYILNMFATSGSKDVISAGEPILIDVLRDPPGGSSTATLSKGSKLKLSYTVDMKFKAGIDITFGIGTSLDNYSGLVAGGTAEYGLINSGKTTNLIDLAVIFSGAGKKAYSYTMTVGEDITTSSAATMVGAEADLYIGVVQNMIVTPMSTIRAIPDSLYQHMVNRLSGDILPTGNTLKYGTLVEIAKGQDAEGNIYHLVRDESLAYGPQLESQFIHSQKHIVSEILPKLANEINALLFTGTLAEAQAQANQTGKPVYLVTKTAEGTGLVEDYQQVLPAGSQQFTDEVAQKLKIMKAWVDMIAMNEREKLNAHDLVANYDVDGGSKVSYSETFETEYSVSQYISYPFTQADYLGTDGVNDGDVTLAIASVLLSQPALASLFKLLSKAMSSGGTSENGTGAGKAGENSLELKFAGKSFQFGIKPVAEYTSTGTYGTQHNYSRKESFNLSMDVKSHLSVDVYRAHTLTTDDQSGDTGNFDVFRNDNFDDWQDAVNNHIDDGVDYSQVIYPHNFVYRTRGGATHNPWEDARYTVAYQPGTPLDERTKKICNPVISLDRQSVSGVAMGEPARFKVYLTNESEYPEAATGSLTMYTFFLDGEHNPNGAKMFVDGSPLNGNGMSVVLYPGKVLEKTLEVYAGSEFDYEGLVIGVASSSDWINTQSKVAFDVHFLHEAGPVLIAQPGDKWVMNTDAQYDSDRGWFLPITISGFNKQQKSFDHIEFQYKESLRGDDSWTNLCSYYADSLLMAQASGQRELIPENGNITTRFYGDGTVMEKAYDLRAVLYCRNGNAFLTTASPIVSGVKDTRRPQLFGTPEPINGILTMGQNIVFNFSEDIEYNYLNAITNFEVKGEVNNQNVTETVSLQFSGNSSVESEAQRNFSGKDLTIDLMIRPDETGRDMPLFSHGTNGKRLQLWLTSDYRLKAVVNDQEFTSAGTIEKGGFTQAAVSIEAPSGTVGGAGSLTFYNGGKDIGTFALTEPYNGTGPLIFGRTNEADRTGSTFYEGRMMEARLWYRAMTGGQIGTTYGSKRLTGYEMGLVDYYPMNEGTGDYAIDKTQGANARLINAAWAMPRGLSLHVDWDDKGIALSQNALNRTSEQDYTLMFWFKTDAEGRGVLLSNGAGSKTEINAANQFNIAFEAEKLMYRSNGHAYDLGSTYSDNQWHHLAMTVNRSYNVANIYVDEALKATFSPDSLGGISGGHPMIGGAQYDELDADGHVATIDTRNWLRGNVDELMFFSQALPLQLIKTYATKSPQGDEAGLLTYLSFDRQERQKDNDIVLVAYPYSKKIYLDDNGNPRYEQDPVTMEPTTTPVRDYVFADSVGEILKHITDETAAPVVPYEELKNLTFSYVGKDNQLLVNINEPDSRINRRNIYVTVRDVEDKNGNTMASPHTACYYVTNSALSWLGNREAITVWYGQDNTDINLLICNNGATSHTYTIENCPKWLSLSTYTDVITPQEYVTITARVNKDLNVGTYDEILYLTDEDGVSEPFYLNLTVEGEQPDWSWNVSSDLLQYSMNIVGRVFINDEIDIDNRDIVGAFGQDGQCHGFAHVSYSTLTGESNLYLTVYDNQANGRDLYFKLWQYATGRELQLTANGGSTLTFQNNTVVGTDTPVRFTGGGLYVQTFDLKEGWNWVSFNVSSERLFNLNTLLDGLPWKEGDVLTDMNSDVTLVYTGGHWLASENPRNIVLSPRKAYAIKVQEDIKFPVAGSIIKADDTRTIDLKKGWNGIGYTPMLNLPIETALSDYYDKAEPGDVIKSHNEFAYFTVTSGVGRWRGSLEYMKPGEGYMLLRKGASATSFRYPFYEPGSTFIDEWSYSTSRSAAPAHARCTMSVSATVEGIELEEGDRLVAFADGEAVGTATVLSGSAAESSEPLYLSIAGNEAPSGAVGGATPLWFAIERDGDIIAATSEQMTFTANAVIGSPDEPTVIRFIRDDNENGRWYTSSGIRLPGRPAYKGVYIYNGKKIVIK